VVAPNTGARIPDRWLSIRAEARRLNTDVAVKAEALITLGAPQRARPWAVWALGASAIDTAALQRNALAIN